MTDHKVTILPDGKDITVSDGTKISDAIKAAGISIALPCGGRGRCGKCGVSVSRGGESERVKACTETVDSDMTVTIPQTSEGRIIAVTSHRNSESDDSIPLISTSKLGIAVDIGTTTVAVSVADPSKCEIVFSDADVNLQRRCGEDVLSRMQYSEDGGTEELRALVLETINGIIKRSGVNTKKIGAAVIAGNTVMTHLFLGIDPSPIRSPPYEPVVRRAELTGADSGLDIAPDAKVVCMPCIASYVGGDITSDIVDSGMDRDSDLALLIDVGTNGEVVLGNKDMLLTCSSSAGPAFEGGNMTSGMLARPGAIDSVRIVDGRIEHTVIGSVTPKGICGSGTIDLLAQLFINGMVDRRGNLTDRSGAVDGILTVAPGVTISQNEILDVIMTKAAIYSATRSLVRNAGVSMDDIRTIYIAGGFGNFINMESAVTIGMFPDVDRDRFVYLGNASLSGASRALASESFRKRVDRAFEMMTYLDLSSDPVFSDEYMSAQFLPNTDESQFPSLKH